MQLAYTVQGSANEQKLLSIKYKIKTVDLDSRMLHFDMQGMEVDPKHNVNSKPFAFCQKTS
jgi:hypothetical protein